MTSHDKGKGIMGSQLRPENWVVAIGVVFAVGIVVASMLPDSFWSENNTTPIAQRDGAMTTPSMRSAVGGVVQGLAGGQTQGQNQAKKGQANDMMGLVPFTRAKSVRFRGRVIRVISLGNDTGWGQMHVWLEDGSGQSQEISIAPDWYLIHMGCIIKENARVDGSAFTFGKARPIAEYYAKTISVGGKTCRLRNDEGFALWSNRLR
ncbi:magnetosome protein MamS [Magnetovibrio sp. PR-2]|uniref:magnetosome protein MamS n=1 Tax=Magnetovibrio sp. PR-2 TaxID=3120356 RepID=UPI002FCE4AC7